MAAQARLKGKITMDDSQFQAVLRKANAAAAAFASKFGSAMKAVGKVGFVGLSAAALAGGAALASASRRALELGGNFSDLSGRTGEAISKLQVAEKAFRDAGLGGDELEASIYRTQKAIAGESSAIAGLGLNFDKLRKMSPVDQMRAIGSALVEIEDPTKRNAVAMEIFGKSGAKLMGVFADTAAFENAAKSLGTMPSLLEKNAGLFDSLGDSIGSLSDKWDQFAVGIASGVAPNVAGFIEKINSADFTPLGVAIAEKLMSAAQTAYAVFNRPDLAFMAFGSYLDSVARGFGNQLISAGTYAAQVYASTFVLAFEGIAPSLKEILLSVNDVFAGGIAKSLSMSLGVVGKIIPGAIGEPIRKASSWLSEQAELFQNRVKSTLPSGDKLAAAFAQAVSDTPYIEKDILGAASAAEQSKNYMDQAKASSGGILANFESVLVAATKATQILTGTEAPTTPAVENNSQSPVATPAGPKKPTPLKPTAFNEAFRHPMAPTPTLPPLLKQLSIPDLSKFGASAAMGDYSSMASLAQHESQPSIMLQGPTRLDSNGYRRPQESPEEFRARRKKERADKRSGKDKKGQEGKDLLSAVNIIAKGVGALAGG